MIPRSFVMLARYRLALLFDAPYLDIDKCCNHMPGEEQRLSRDEACRCVSLQYRNMGLCVFESRGHSLCC